jgi:hypothetical protein
MNPFVQGAIATGGFTVFIMIASWVRDAWNKREERKEWYRRTLLEKRLTAVQEGYAWLMRLNRAHDLAGNAKADVSAVAREARKWYDSNCLFLEDCLPKSSSFIGATNSVGKNGFFDNLISAEDLLRKRVRWLFEDQGEFVRWAEEGENA